MDDICDINLRKAIDEGMEAYLEEGGRSVDELVDEIDEALTSGNDSKNIKSQFSDKALKEVKEELAHLKAVVSQNNKAQETAVRVTKDLKRDLTGGTFHITAFNRVANIERKVRESLINIFVNNSTNKYNLEAQQKTAKVIRFNAFMGMFDDKAFMGKADKGRVMQLLQKMSEVEELELLRLTKKYDKDISGKFENNSSPEMDALARAVHLMSLKGYDDMTVSGVLVDYKKGRILGRYIDRNKLLREEDRLELKRFIQGLNSNNAVDWDRMVKNGNISFHKTNPKTGKKVKMSLDEMEVAKLEFIDAYVDTVGTYDVDTAHSSIQKGDKSGSMQQHKRRVLDIVDGFEADELEFNRRWGSGSFIETFVVGLNQTSRDITNANFMGNLGFKDNVASKLFRDINDNYKEYGITKDEARGVTEKLGLELENTDSYINSAFAVGAEIDSPVGHNVWADVGATTNSLEVMGLLGSSQVASWGDSAIGSTVLGQFSRHMNLPEQIVDTIRPIGRFLGIGDNVKMNKELGIEGLNNNILLLDTIKRHGDKMTISEGEGSFSVKARQYMSYQASRFMNLTKQTRWNEVAKNNITYQMSRRMGGYLKTPYSALPDNIKGLLEDGNIKPQEWDAIRVEAEPSPISGETFFSGRLQRKMSDEKIKELYSVQGQGIARERIILHGKIDGLLIAMRDIGVLEPAGKFTAKKTALGGRRGTVRRALVDSAGFLRGFAVGWVQQVPSMLSRSARLRGGGIGGYASVLVPQVTLSLSLGMGVITPIKRLSRGQSAVPDFSDETDRNNFIFEGLLYAGFGGIGTEVMASLIRIATKKDVTNIEIMSSIGNFIAGPGLVLPTEVMARAGLLIKALAEDVDGAGREWVNFIHSSRKFLPMNNFLYTRIITDAIFRMGYAELDPSGWKAVQPEVTQKGIDALGM